ncbi:hypothetical protein [Natronorarus salvus]|uniref:hypothetical protein n=1 Tax=Natronorarus salvus TaxID=3117733 RepID=UPI002F26B8CD
MTDEEESLPGREENLPVPGRRYPDDDPENRRFTDLLIPAVEEISTRALFRDSEDSVGDYPPLSDAVFIATDTGAVYEADGSAWTLTELSLSGLVIDGEEAATLADLPNSAADVDAEPAGAVESHRLGETHDQPQPPQAHDHQGDVLDPTSASVESVGSESVAVPNREWVTERIRSAIAAAELALLTILTDATHTVAENTTETYRGVDIEESGTLEIEVNATLEIAETI